MGKKTGMLDQAITFATTVHSGAVRKGNDRPYIIHPLEVMTIVATITDDQNVLSAAVLHDTIEDTGVTKEVIQALFGERVADLVASETENKRKDQAAESTWKVRKEETLQLLRTVNDRDVKLICLGDKLANLREISRDYAALGDKVWERFHQKDKKEHCWYYSSVYEILRDEFGDIPATENTETCWKKCSDGKMKTNETTICRSKQNARKTLPRRRKFGYPPLLNNTAIKPA